MTDRDCVVFLQWSLPRLGLRWAGFRKVRRQVCKRISRRMGDLGLGGAEEYRAYLESNESEWRTLDGLCRVTVSRFYRDRGVYDALRSRVLPRLAKTAADRGGDRVRCWSAGCASGEEPYTLRIIWPREAARVVRLEITATDVDEVLLERARAGKYPKSSLKDLPANLVDESFSAAGADYVIEASHKRNVEFVRQDIRKDTPRGPFDVVLCRNLAFTYFDNEQQTAVLDSIRRELAPGGILVIGVHESLPPGAEGLEPFESIPGVYRRGGTGKDTAA